MRRALIGVIVAAGLVFGMTACGGSPPQTDTLATRVTGTTAVPADFTVKKGDTVKLSITADKDEEVHLHGYDIHFECKAGVPLEKTFTADKTGQFEYEIEATAQHLGNLTVNP